MGASETHACQDNSIHTCSGRGHHIVWCYECHNVIGYDACDHDGPSLGADEPTFTSKPVPRYQDKAPRKERRGRQPR